MSRVNISGYVRQLNVHSCELFSSRVRVKFRFWLVSGDAYVFIILSVFYVTPHILMLW